MTPHPIIDLSERSVALAGLAFSNVFDRINRDATRDHHIAGLWLIEELRRQGLSLTRPRPLLSLDTEKMFPVLAVDAYARALAMWETEDPDPTIPLPALTFADEG